MYNSAKRTLTIPNGASASNAIVGKLLSVAKAVTVHAPAALTAAVTVQVSADEDTPVYTDLYNGTVACVCAVSRATRWELAGSNALRLNSAGTELADRIFEVTFHFE